MGPDVLYLDFDGVLHPGPVHRYRKPPTIRLADPTHKLFESCETLEALLVPYPSVKIVLSTSWVKTFSYSTARSFLTQNIQSLVIGATYHARMDDARWFTELSRYQQILGDVTRRKTAHWVAVDDDVEGWDERHAAHLAHMPEAYGLSSSHAQDLLAARLAQNFGAP